ncbi:hypothetical protein CDL12_06842 [Handroanthus impetiginosus]|uniref:PB1-like domain-containing protein n=1 Tax=Handroanthus impetiginosus TaxID=429701 RepID=A0A2G9HSH1_9LAMI|nr:hypothetical protein CDL12_06842 [Handroanthus impetiginosus]
MKAWIIHRVDDKVDFVLWIGGKFVGPPNLRYEGGSKHEYPKYDVDYLNEDALWEMYKEVGGMGTTVNFYFVVSSLSMEFDLRRIQGDIGITDVIHYFSGLDECTIYAEDVDCSPLQAIDIEGNIIFTKNSSEVIATQATEEEI